MSDLVAGAKRIAMFLDGTDNTIEDNTNVWRLKRLCKVNAEQITYYSPGVGTKADQKIIGGAIGYGIDEEIINAYEWLVDHYNDNDEIFIFGFSRGAYTARSLSGLILKCGLMRPGAPLLIKEIYARYRLNNTVQDIQELKEAKDAGRTLTEQDEWLLRYCYAPPVKFLGVWDTVGALGISVGDIEEISKASYNFLETDLRRKNLYAFHALAVDEHRSQFAPTLWTKKKSNKFPDRPLEQVEQRWFVGAHSNVGGGYEGDLLAQRPLKWLRDKAVEQDLEFRDEVTLYNDGHSDPITDSYAKFLGGVYKLLVTSNRHYRPIGQDPIPTDPQDPANNINETIDSSVFKRWQKNADYQKACQNLNDWAEKYGAPLGGLKNSVRANNYKETVPDIMDGILK